MSHVTDSQKSTLSSGLKTLSAGGGSLLKTASKSQLSALKSTLTKISAGLKESSGGGGGITSDSNNAVNNETQLGGNISSLNDRFGLGSSGDDNTDILYKMQKEQAAQIERERAALEARRAGEVAGIEEGFGVAKTDTEFAQKREVGGTSAALAASGGYLGNTASQQGVLQNLTLVHRQEMVSLEAKKNEAIRAANNAFEDRDFELAREYLKSARELEGQVYTRQQDFFNRQLDLAGEQRAQLQESRASIEFKNKQTQESIDRIVNSGRSATTTEIMQLAQAQGISPDEAQSRYDATKRSYDLTQKKDKTTTDLAIISQLRGIPRDKSITIDGQKYWGLAELSKTGTSLSYTERKDIEQAAIKKQFTYLVVNNNLKQDEAIKAFDELDISYINDFYEVMEGAEDKRFLETKLANDEWDLYSDPDKKDPVVYNKTEYKAAVQKWQTDSAAGTFNAGEIKGDDDLKLTITIDGVSYVGKGELIKDSLFPPADIEKENFAILNY